MLVTPPLHASNPILDILTMHISKGNPQGPIQLAPGIIRISHHSGDMLLWGRNAPEMYMGWPELAAGMPNCYGVCDSVEQFMAKCLKGLIEDERTFCVFVTHVAKDPNNKGNGGGWRWHKWGPYIGDGVPTTEYLDDEEKFEHGVFCYHVYQIAGREIDSEEWAAAKKRLEDARLAGSN